MLLILEDNPDKRSLLLDRYRRRTEGKTILCADSVKKGQLLVQKLLDGGAFELWLDNELVGSSGLDFLNWLIEYDCKPTYVLVTTFTPRVQNEMKAICVANNMPHSVWAGPFG